MKALKRLFDRRPSSVEVSEESGVRMLHLGGEAIQSAIRLADPDRLELAYTRAMMAFLLFRPDPREVLMIGLGGGSLARFLHRHLPRARTIVVEINRQVVAAARALFGLPPDDARLAVVVDDGAKFVPAHPASADVILLDGFEDGVSVPELCTQVFFDACREALRPDGVLVVNFMSGERRLATYLARIARAFEGRMVALPAEDLVNTIVFAFRSSRVRWPVADLEREGRVLARRYGLPGKAFVHSLLDANPRTAGYLRLTPGAAKGARGRASDAAAKKAK